jgi:hypothetical protein
MSELAELLDRPNAQVEARVSAALDSGPIHPDDALRFAELSSLFEPGYLRAETGYCTHEDGRGYVAVLTKMPGVTAEMLDWWFDWHPRDPLRYRVWFPQDHFDISIEPATRPGAKPFYNTIHHPVEDVGLGRDRIRIEFLDPVEFGFPAGSVPSEGCATIVCGYAGEDARRVRHTKMCHFARETEEGIELRSRFWIGERIELYAAVGRPINPLLNTTLVRSKAVPAAAPAALARHCAQEYTNLGALLPELWTAYGS